MADARLSVSNTYLNIRKKREARYPHYTVTAKIQKAWEILLEDTFPSFGGKNKYIILKSKNVADMLNEINTQEEEPEPDYTENIDLQAATKKNLAMGAAGVATLGVAGGVMAAKDAATSAVASGGLDMGTAMMGTMIASNVIGTTADVSLKAINAVEEGKAVRILQEEEEASQQQENQLTLLELKELRDTLNLIQQKQDGFDGSAPFHEREYDDDVNMRVLRNHPDDEFEFLPKQMLQSCAVCKKHKTIVIVICTIIATHLLLLLF